MLHVACLSAPRRRRARRRGSIADRSPPDAFAVVGADVYLSLPNGVARSKLTNAWLDAELGVVSTMRNWRTVTKLAAMVEARALSLAVDGATRQPPIFRRRRAPPGRRSNSTRRASRRRHRLVVAVVDPWSARSGAGVRSVAAAARGAAPAARTTTAGAPELRIQSFGVLFEARGGCLGQTTLGPDPSRILNNTGDRRRWGKCNLGDDVSPLRIANLARLARAASGRFARARSAGRSPRADGARAPCALRRPRSPA